jgi:hypothetical protein
VQGAGYMAAVAPVAALHPMMASSVRDFLLFLAEIYD